MDKPRILRISPVATQSCHATVAAVDQELIQRKALDARQSARRREIHRFHQDDAESLHRMLNALQPGSYVRPHRHLDPPKAESLILLQGMLAHVVFTEEGLVEHEGSILLDAGRGVYGCDIRPGVWHTIFALAPDTVIFEVKPGPYSPATDKDFAAWAPQEGRPEATTFLAELEDNFRRLQDLPPRTWKPSVGGEADSSPQPRQ